MDTRAELAPDTTGWSFLAAKVVSLAVGERLIIEDALRESAVVLVQGAIEVKGAVDAVIDRASPFEHEAASVVYVPPLTIVAITAIKPSEIAIGAAPAQGLYPADVITPDRMSSELRGEKQTRRKVISTLADPVPAERLIVYEAWVERGCWAGWPPHRHDGENGSPYLEETYYFRFNRAEGFGLHRNYAEGFDQLIPIRDGSLVAVPRGYHVCGAAPAADMWVLNFLAGDPDDRARPPYFDPIELSKDNMS